MIDVVVVTADSKEMILACLRELVAPGIATITVVDNELSWGADSAFSCSLVSAANAALESPLTWLELSAAS